MDNSVGNFKMVPSQSCFFQLSHANVCVIVCSMQLGKLWQWFGNRRGMTILTMQLGMVVVFSFLYTGYQSSDRCVSCHADKVRMTKLGYPQFVMTAEQVQNEARHPNTSCRDCHLGNGLSDDPDIAHRGVLKLTLLDNKFEIMPRKKRTHRLLPSGNDRQRSMLPRLPDGTIDDDVGTLLYHDHNQTTYGYDPRIAEKTCGQSACHPNEVDQFNASVMGSNFRQRSMRTWTDIHGPNN